MNRLSTVDRVYAVKLGWQAECAILPHATHLATLMPAVDPDITPTTLVGCAEFGRKMLRAAVASMPSPMTRLPWLQPSRPTRRSGPMGSRYARVPMPTRKGSRR